MAVGAVNCPHQLLLWGAGGGLDQESRLAVYDQSQPFAGRAFNGSFNQNMPLGRRKIVWQQYVPESTPHSTMLIAKATVRLVSADFAHDLLSATFLLCLSI